MKASSLARWNRRTGAWSDVGGGVTGCMGLFTFGCTPTIYAIAVDGNYIYVGGNFTKAGGITARGIARWNTATETWYALREGVSCEGAGCSAVVRAIAVANDVVYVGGNFDYAGGLLVNNAAAWDDYGWATMADGRNGTVYSMVKLGNGKVAVGGSFVHNPPYLSEWDPNTLMWYAFVGGILNDSVYAIAPVAQYDLYFGGSFTDGNGDPDADHVGGLIEGYSVIDPLGDGVNNDVRALAYNGVDLYAGGSFTASGSIGMNQVGKWDGSNWSSLGSGTDDAVYAIIYNNGKVYVGGSFLNAGGKPSFYFGRWGSEVVYLPLVVK